MSTLDSLFRDLLVFQGYTADPGLLAELEARRGPAAPGAPPGQPAPAKAPAQPVAWAAFR